MTIQALGYIGLHATSLEDWSGFATGVLGLQLSGRSNAELAFRMDDRSQRLVVARDATDAPAFFGWEVADAAALDGMAARLEAAGHRVARGDAALCDRRRVRGLIATTDPFGNRVELVHGPEITAEPFRPGRTISGFRTGALGMGHAVMLVQDIAAGLAFYRDVLGFGVSDWIERPFRAYFMHVNGRHHSFAMLESPAATTFHHFMVELFNLDDVGQGYDIAQEQEGRIATTLGRHANDLMTSFYARTPGGFLVEYGWGGRRVDPATHQPEECTAGPSLWGHERLRMTAEQRAEAHAMRRAAADKGLRAPVQVVAGNFAMAPGECAWWDDVKGAAE
jgi:2,3-dihydroxybiphenyl 1,2-dioxygenase